MADGKSSSDERDDLTSRVELAKESQALGSGKSEPGSISGRSTHSPVDKTAGNDSIDFFQEERGFDQRKPFSLKELNDLLRHESHRREEEDSRPEWRTARKELPGQKYQYGIFRHIYESLNEIDEPSCPPDILPMAGTADGLPAGPPDPLESGAVKARQSPCQSAMIVLEEPGCKVPEPEVASSTEAYRSLELEKDAFTCVNEELKNSLEAEKEEHRSTTLKYEALRSEHEQLRAAYSALMERLETSSATGSEQERYQALVREFELEKHSHKLALLKYESLKREHEILKRDLDVLKSEYDGLNEILSNFLA